MNHREQKDAARAEALDHMKANVMTPRAGKDHEDHKYSVEQGSYPVKIGEAC